MDPTATPPWRVLENPPGDGSERRPVPPPSAPSVSPTLKTIAIGGAAATIAILAFILATSGGDGTVIVDGGASLGVGQPPSTSAGIVTGGELVVEIVGAVPGPGVYRLPLGSRVVDLVEAAGGYGPRVDTGQAEARLNLAAELRDGDQVRVPSRDDPDDVEGSPGTGTAVGSDAALVDLNEASQTELETLPGIGPATAEKIIAAREEAAFGAVDELRSRGILGEKTFEKVRELVTVG